jgi:predicted DNA-binding transcriptional regulator YafY
MARIGYIDRRLRQKRDFPSKSQLIEGMIKELGEEPCTKTVQRDIDWMRDEGAPIEYEPTRHGYYYTDENWQLPAVALTEGDLLAILVTERALAGYRNSPYYRQIRSIFERLIRLLPDRVTVSSEDLARDVSVISEPATQIDEGVWQAVRDGLEKNRRVVITYQAPGKPKAITRRVDPLHLVGHRGEWYLLCWSHHDGGIRIYALARVKRATITDERYTPPEGFSVGDYIDPAFGVFINEPPVEVAIALKGRAAAAAHERTWHPKQEIETDADGRTILRFETNQQSQLLYWVSQWGPSAEILEPAALRRRAAEWFAGTASRYSDVEL